MSTSLTRHTHSLNFIQRYFSNVAASKLPRKLKRLIYISSLLGLIEQARDPDLRLVHKLNQIFRVAKYEDSFLFPAYVNSLIWKDVADMVVEVEGQLVMVKNINNLKLSREARLKLGEFFMSLMPRWLRYGSDELIISDGAVLIENIADYKRAQ